jgi:hypothetical protein
MTRITLAVASESIVGTAHPADDMNIRTLKRDMRPDHANLGVGIDTNKRTKCKCGSVPAELRVIVKGG